MSNVHHTKLQVNGPSGQCSHLDFHCPPEVLNTSRIKPRICFVLNYLV